MPMPSHVRHGNALWLLAWCMTMVSLPPAAVCARASSLPLLHYSATTIRMGGGIDHIECRRLQCEDEVEMSGASLQALCRSFDVRKSTCSLVHDRDRLLLVIESGFGTLSAFNAVARSFLAAAFEKEAGRRRSSRSPFPSQRRTTTPISGYSPARPQHLVNYLAPPDSSVGRGVGRL